MKKTMLAVAAMIAVAASGTTFAQAMNDPYAMPWTGGFWGHVGISGGESKFRQDCYHTNVFDCDQRDSAWKVYTGGQFNRLLGLEVGYNDFGKMRTAGGDTKAWAIPVTLNIGAPIGRFDVFGKVGGVYGHTEVSAAPAALVDTGTKSGWGWTGGVGADFRVTPNFDIRADYDRYRMDFAGAGTQDVDMLSAGVQFRF